MKKPLKPQQAKKKAAGRASSGSLPWSAEKAAALRKPAAAASAGDCSNCGK